jgi:hypothetical protein
MAVAAGGVDELDRALAFCAGRDDDYAVHDNVVGRLNLEGVACPPGTVTRTGRDCASLASGTQANKMAKIDASSFIAGFSI